METCSEEADTKLAFPFLALLAVGGLWRGLGASLPVHSSDV